MATETFELSSIESTDEATITLKHPNTGDDLPVTVTVFNPDSDAAKESNTKMRAKITRYIERNKGASAEQKQIFFDRVERERNIALIKSINGVTDKGVPFTNVEELCKIRPWILTQASEAVNCTSNFIKDSLPAA